MLHKTNKQKVTPSIALSQNEKKGFYFPCSRAPYFMRK